MYNKYILSEAVYSCTGITFSQSLCTAVQEVSSLRVCVQLYRKYIHQGLCAAIQEVHSLRVCVQLYRKYAFSESVYTELYEVDSLTVCVQLYRKYIPQGLCTAVQEVHSL